MRRTREMLLVSGLAFVVIAGGNVAQAAPPPGWDHSGYDAEDSYFNPRQKPFSADRLTPLWHATLRVNHDEYCGQGQSQPIIVGGRVFAPDQLGISALAADTGLPLWQFTWPDPSDAGMPMMVVSGRFLIAAMASCQSASDPTGDIVALDLASGAVRWRIHSNVPYYSLAVDKGVAVVSGSSPSADLKSTAYRASDGHPIWVKPGYDSSGVSANGTLLMTGFSQTTAVAITSGLSRWSKPGTWKAQSATPASDRFLVTSGDTLAAVNVYDGSTEWTARGLASDLIATDGDHVYLAINRTVRALVARNGHPAWSHTLPIKAQQPVIAGGQVFTGSHVLSAITGTSVSSGFPGQDSIVSGRVYALDDLAITAYNA